ncbi:uncharacterized protein LOC143288343 isoform X3 [Babylonia areolata]|uniref:uncharacterized protein LOC143288343 isoform X3 n=1 Tax=Babylonia areolata TaxID=304850 RepID=UPI003FD40F3A
MACLLSCTPLAPKKTRPGRPSQRPQQARRKAAARRVIQRGEAQGGSNSNPTPSHEEPPRASHQATSSKQTRRVVDQ